MNRLVECVPNFSEGRRSDVVDALAEAVESVAGVQLLDRSSDVDHNRSVLTFAGEAGPVSEAAARAVAVAVDQIDMTRHAGQHPRLGAVDVVPFVPLGDTSIDECVEVARDFGRRIAEQHALPVYLYARAATRPEREVLADIRRPQFEGLRDLIGQPEHQPDFGPAKIHATAGATVVGARPFLIAYNINLQTEDVELAKRIARRVRERSGGLPRVQALGLYLDDLRCAQVSMNLLDHEVTPIWRVWQTVAELARTDGVDVRESEVIGLWPLAAMLAVADHAGVNADLDEAARVIAAAEWLRVRGFRPGMVLELRMAELAGGSP
jgi:glutamate formiminotransferase / 5-formyltetrahydrofolate cyclo-ligase